MHDPMGNGAAQFSVSDDGTLVTISGLARRRLVWMDRRGQFEPLSLPESTYLGPALSPNGRQVAMMIREQAGTNIWVYDLEREALTKLTFTGDNYWPIWSPDGNRVLFGHNDPIKGEPGIFSISADGGLAPERLTTADSIQNPSGYSPDGKVLALTSLSPTWDIFVLRAGESSPEAFLTTPFAEGDARFSPDGRWIAHISIESGRREVYVRSFPEGSDRQQISTNGGDVPMWNPKGGELFYKEGNRMMAVEVETGSGSFRASKPRVLYERRFLPGINGADRFAVSLDGERFLLTGPSENSPASGQINVVVNWFEVVRQRAPSVN
jgi:Tol biopolymer transport system component